MTRVAVVPQVSGVGGMVSFRGRFGAGLETRGIETATDLNAEGIAAVLVIGGTRDLPGLWRAKRNGARIVQRLNGMNWLHRRMKTGLRHALRAEYGNWLLRAIRARLADHVIYQSEFARGWWERVHGPTRVSSSVVHNAVDLGIYTPEHPDPSGVTPRPGEIYRVLMVEGSLMGGYEMGLESAVGLVRRLNAAYSHLLDKPVELMIAGRVSEQVKNLWSGQAGYPLNWAGLVPPKQIIDLDRHAHLLYSSDINAACPNAVIEALACGLPVLAFDSGAIPELVRDGAGEVIPYGGDPWQLDPPDIKALAAGAVEILIHQESYRLAARTRAETAFGLDRMMAGYMAALLD